MARILVVDDSADNRDMLSRRLVRVGHQAPTAADGREALDVVGRDPPDLILLDIMMPGLDGIEVLIRLRETYSAAALPVIMVTARDGTESVVESLRLGANDYVTKPIDFPVLLARVEGQLALHAEFEQRGDGSTDAAAGDDWPDPRTLIDAGESGTAEFKSTLRWNLKAGRAGKEIELAWLKTVVAFLNTDGGVLLVGVEDDGSALGIEPDHFENADRYLLHVNNLIRKHVGLEHAALIRFALRPCRDRQVLVVECRPSRQPAFLRDGNDETFYVRVGPGSRELNTRQVLRYIDERRGRDGETP